MRITKDMVAAIALGAIAIAYWVLSYEIPQAGASQVGPAFLPRVIAALTLLLSVVLAVNSRRPRADHPGTQSQSADDDQAKADADAPANYVPVLLTIALLAVYINVLDPLGFVPATAGYLFLQFNVSAPKNRHGPKSQAGFAVIAIAFAFAVNYAFVNGFNVMLPQGILD